MAHSECYPDGSGITKFFKGCPQELANKFAEASGKAFLAGADKVEQRIIQGNEICPMCESGLRFDLCCGKEE